MRFPKRPRVTVSKYAVSFKKFFDFDLTAQYVFAIKIFDSGL
jgi:hypothetical protein